MSTSRQTPRRIPGGIPRGLSVAVLVVAGLLGLVVGRAGVGVGEVGESSGTTGAQGTSEQQAASAENHVGAVFHEAFNGNPDQPTSRMNQLPGWFAQPVMQGTNGWDTAPEPMMAQHAANCGAAPATHHIESYADTVFSCKDHLMTALNPPSGGTASGEVVLKPNHLVDLSEGTATVRIDVSTSSSTLGDWWETWITPWDDQLVAPVDHWFHQNGPPLNSVVLLVRGEHMGYAVFQGGTEVARVEWWAGTPLGLEASDTRRDTYEFKVSGNHVVATLPAYDNRVLADFDIPAGLLGASAVVQFEQGDYEPEKNGKIGCGDEDCPTDYSPNTWHWDNAHIEPAIPYTLIPTDTYQVWAGDDHPVTFAQPAPTGAELLFAGYSVIAAGMDVSFDGGTSWQAAQQVRPNNDSILDADLLSYRVDVPEGATAVQVRGTDADPSIPLRRWAAQNFHVVSRQAPVDLGGAAQPSAPTTTTAPPTTTTSAPPAPTTTAEPPTTAAPPITAAPTTTTAGGHEHGDATTTTATTAPTTTTTTAPAFCQLPPSTPTTTSPPG